MYLGSEKFTTLAIPLFFLTRCNLVRPTNDSMDLLVRPNRLEGLKGTILVRPGPLGLQLIGRKINNQYKIKYISKPIGNRKLRLCKLKT
jgi:hypothetical protein